MSRPLTRKAWRFVWQWLACLLVLATVLPVTIDPPYTTNGPAIRSDGLGYHLWTRALLERDLRFCQFDFADPGLFAQKVEGRDVCLNKYPPGLALLRLPVMAPLVERDPGAPLVSEAENRASLYLGALALLLVCVLATATCRLLGVPAVWTNLAVLTFVFGTGLFHYGTYDSSFTHVYSALGIALLIWLGVRAKQFDARRVVFTGSGLTAFFLVAIRLTNLIPILILLVGYLLWGRRSDWTTRGQDIVPVLLGTLVALGIQVAYNQYAMGHLTISSYGAYPLLFDRPRQLHVLASYDRGLFTWYPIVAVSVVTSLAAASTRRAATLFCLGLVALAILYGFWFSPSLGGGFGHRGFVELMPAGMVVFAAALAAIRPRWRLIVSVSALVATFATVELMSGYWRSTVPVAESPPDIFWSHVVGDESWLP